MRQTVNFYRGAARFSSTPWGAAWVLRCALGTSVLCLCVSLWQIRAERALKAQAGSMRVQAEAMERALQEWTSQHPDLKPDGALLAEAEKAERRRSNLERLLKETNADYLDRRRGFSPYLIALARQASGEVWLSGIRLSGSGQIALRGGALEADRIPSFLRALGEESAFRDGAFPALNIRRQTGKAQVEFQLGADFGEEPAGGKP